MNTNLKDLLKSHDTKPCIEKKRIKEGCRRVSKTHNNVSRRFLLNRRMVPTPTLLDDTGAGPLPGGHHTLDSLAKALYIPRPVLCDLVSTPGFPEEVSPGYWSEESLDEWVMETSRDHLLKFLWRWWLVERDRGTWRVKHGYVNTPNLFTPYGTTERIRVV